MFSDPNIKRQTRLPHRVPTALIDLLNKKAKKHIPEPRIKDFYEFILDMGIKDYIHGTPLKMKSLPRPETDDGWDKFSHYIDPRFAYQIKGLHAEHLPKTTKRTFFEYIVMLGLQAYEKEYTIYGFKKD